MCDYTRFYICWIYWQSGMDWSVYEYDKNVFMIGWWNGLGWIGEGARGIPFSS